MRDVALVLEQQMHMVDRACCTECAHGVAMSGLVAKDADSWRSADDVLGCCGAVMRCQALLHVAAHVWRILRRSTSKAHLQEHTTRKRLCPVSAPALALRAERA